MIDDVDARARAILAQVKPLAVEFYRVTKKPLGVTGEIAEYLAAEKLGLRLADARTSGYDALRGDERIQIKGRAIIPGKPGGRMSRIKADAEFDSVVLVIMDIATLEPIAMWEAKRQAVVQLLSKTKSAARVRGQLSVPEFTRQATQVWPLA